MNDIIRSLWRAFAGTTEDLATGSGANWTAFPSIHQIDLDKFARFAAVNLSQDEPDEISFDELVGEILGETDFKVTAVAELERLYEIARRALNGETGFDPNDQEFVEEVMRQAEG